MSEPHAIDELASLCQVLPCVPEKFIVDFANGLNVSHDHVRAQRARTGFFARCQDFLSGQGARRQNEVDANLAGSLDASLDWLTRLTESQARSNLAISRVSERVNLLMLDLAAVANHSETLAEKLSASARSLERRIDMIENEVARVDFIQRVQLNLDQVFNRWRAGKFSGLSPAGRCYAAMVSLYWGAFGDYCRFHDGAQREAFVEDAANRAAAQLAEDAGCTVFARLDTRRWLRAPDVLVGRNAGEALAYLGDSSVGSRSPFIFTISQCPAELPVKVPLIASASRVSEALVLEMFRGDRSWQT
jgi:hypothetical protein